MRFIVKDQPDWIGGWVADKVGFEYIPGRMTAIGLVDENERVLGGVVFYDYTGSNIWMHVAVASESACSGARDFVKSIFTYVFTELGCSRCCGWIPVHNEAAINLDLKLGFTPEYVLKNAGTDGDHVLMIMDRENCRWIKR